MRAAKLLRRFGILLLALLPPVLFLFLAFVFYPRKVLSVVLPDPEKITYIEGDIRGDSVKLKIALMVQNRSPFTVIADSMSFNIKVAGVNIVAEKFPVLLRQEKFERDTVIIPASFSLGRVKKILASLQGTDSMLTEISGTIVYSTLARHTRLDFDRKKVIPVLIPPKIKVVRVERGNYDLVHSVLPVRLKLEILNVSRHLRLQLSGFHYDMVVEDVLHTSGMWNKKISIEPGSVQQIDLPMALVIDKPVKAVWLTKLDKRKLGYKVRLRFSLLEDRFLFYPPTPVELNASGETELQAG